MDTTLLLSYPDFGNSSSKNASMLTISFIICGGVVVSNYGLYVGGPGSIPTAITIMTAAGGDAEHVSLNH